MVSFKQKGDFSKLNSFLERSKRKFHLSELDKFGREGVEALSAATPIDSGMTAQSWSYKITQTPTGITISFHNSNKEFGAPVAILLQYGHATRNGGYVQGRDYINPAIQPIFDKIAKYAWKEVTKT